MGVITYTPNSILPYYVVDILTLVVPFIVTFCCTTTRTLY